MYQSGSRNDGIWQFGFMIFTNLYAFVNNAFSQIKHRTIVHKTNK